MDESRCNGRKDVLHTLQICCIQARSPLMQAGRFEIFRLDQLLRSPVQPINRRNLFSTTVTFTFLQNLVLVRVVCCCPLQLSAHQQTSAAIFSPADVE
ncbi:Indole-3-glycerol phosphate synthase [Trichinella spiralis]|uniref:Indole-3-glycerol phosphate synthase n=1 Tax=Trichinella spiralis TaxID=6334 RepID=A0ABR3KMV6_TRISP